MVFTLQLSVLLGLLAFGLAPPADAKSHHLRAHGHHHVHKRQARQPKMTSAAFGKLLNLDMTGISPQCKKDLFTSNQQCVQVIIKCMKNETDSCPLELKNACTGRCGSNQCSFSFSILAVSAPPRLPSCVPQSCRTTTTAYRHVLTALTKAVFITASKYIRKSVGGFFDPVQSVTLKCSTGQVQCKGTSQCSFRQVKSSHRVRPTHPTPEHGTFSIYDHADFGGKGQGPHSAKHPGAQHGRRPHTPTRKPQESGGSHEIEGSHRADESQSSEEERGIPSHQDIPGPGVNPHHHSTSSITCGNTKCKAGLQCCRVGGVGTQCCSQSASSLLNKVISGPLAKLSGTCATDLIKEKGKCISTYVKCLSDVTDVLKDFQKAGASVPDFEAIEEKLETCNSLSECITESDGQPCLKHQRCTLSGSVAPQFAGSKSAAYSNSSLCLPDSCKTNDNLQGIVSLLQSSVCGPFCVARMAASSLAAFHIPSICPIKTVGLVCLSGPSKFQFFKKETPSEEDCHNVVKLLKTAVSAQAKNSHGGSNAVQQRGGSNTLRQRGGSNTLRQRGGSNTLRQHDGHSHNEPHKKPLASNTWFIVGVVCGGVVLLVALPLFVRWRIYSARRNAVQFSYSHIRPESPPPCAGGAQPVAEAY